MMPAAVNLSPEHELFAASVASGLSYRKAAKLAGFHIDNGFRLMQMPEVRARVNELVNEPDEQARARVNAEFMILLNRVSSAEGKAYDPDLHMRVLLGFAKFKGWIIDKKQVDKRSLTASVRVDRQSLELIQQDLERLAPGATGQLERLGRTATQDEIRAIASGESVTVSGE